MVEYDIYFSKQAAKDKKLVKQAGLENKTRTLIEIIKIDPFQNPPPYEKLVGNFDGLFSRRISFQHRLVYQIIEAEKAIKILRMWSHYEDIR
ncbi:Txe/YoeB family addiction module toxin [Anaerotalea alkaliphila]|uniref:Endoribonuclease YoeB n=1 Tax=Anaerotalea alkaliphila TaxID=2662126 RepID=A0A7X5HX62_9FIRM|nr:Txe/YoeB family addiction module toxin [Anaerotalea alkaliphila]NDL68243.1 Txe/YoeB family addiction module toxin [Anaerotalea alkaliphila]